MNSIATLGLARVNSVATGGLYQLVDQTTTPPVEVTPEVDYPWYTFPKERRVNLKSEKIYISITKPSVLTNTIKVRTIRLNLKLTIKSTIQNIKQMEVQVPTIIRYNLSNIPMKTIISKMALKPEIITTPIKTLYEYNEKIIVKTLNVIKK